MSEKHEAESRIDSQKPDTAAPEAEVEADVSGSSELPKEIGGRSGPEPTRFGDWEKNGRCIDF